MPERASVGCHEGHPCRPSPAPSGADGGTPREDGGGNGAPGELRRWGPPRSDRRRGDGPPGPGSSLAGYRRRELFGRAVRFLRKARRLRLVDLAPRAGVSLGRLSEIENGVYPSWQGAADDLARALDLPDAAALLRAVYGRDYPSAAAPSAEP